jgi:probable rRNA maturation factor
VISFLLDCEPEVEESPTERPAISRGLGQKLDGELVISTETARREAENFGWSAREETVLYLIHGLLHLVGYDDLSSTEQAVMRARERAMLALFHISPPQQSEANPGEDGGSPCEPEAEPGEDPERPSSPSPPRSRRTES